jgi:thiol reductant ABC exporter CydC subunit
MSGALLAGLRQHRRRAAVVVGLGAAAVAAGIGLLATSGYLISKAALEPPILSLTVAIVGVRFFAIARAVFRYLERVVSHDLTFRLLADLRVRFFRRLVPVAPAARSGDLLSRFVGDVDSLQHFFLRALAPPLVALATGVVAVAVTAAFSPEAALVLLAGLVVAATLIPLVGWLASRSAGRRRSPARGELSAELVEVLRGGPELLAYGATHERRRRVEAADARVARLARREAVTSGLTAGLGMLVTSATVVGVVVAAAGRVDGVYLAALAFIALAAFEGFTPLAAAAQQLSLTAGAAHRLEAVASGPTVEEPLSPVPPERAQVVALEGARLRYDGGPWVLDGVDLALAPGRRVALVGASGSGKTTIARLLVRFEELDEGRATLNSRDLSEFAHADVRREIVLAAEDAYLFASTIRENVRLARPGATDEEIRDALERAGAGRWVDSVPDGLDTFVGEDGALVSGGQRQRIALARALLSDASILVLDEPTVHLDDEGATAFVDDLFAATDGVGLLLITHRLDGLARFDEIVVLDRGRVVERGTEAELLAAGGAFTALARAGQTGDAPDSRAALAA